MRYFYDVAWQHIVRCSCYFGLSHELDWTMLDKKSRPTMLYMLLQTPLSSLQGISITGDLTGVKMIGKIDMCWLSAISSFSQLYSKPQALFLRLQHVRTLPGSRSFLFFGSRSEEKQRSGYWLTQTMKLFSRTHAAAWSLNRHNLRHKNTQHMYTVQSEFPKCPFISTYF